MGRRGESLQAEVLEMTRRRNCPSSAYDVLEELRKSNPKLAPTTVYRALAALIDRGRIHRLESLNSYIACQCERHHHASILSICDGCGCVEENVDPDLLAKLTSVLRKTGFAAKRHVIELHGRCASCLEADAAP